MSICQGLACFFVTSYNYAKLYAAAALVMHSLCRKHNLQKGVILYTIVYCAVIFGGIY